MPGQEARSGATNPFPVVLRPRRYWLGALVIYFAFTAFFGAAWMFATYGLLERSMVAGSDPLYLIISMLTVVVPVSAWIITFIRALRACRRYDFDTITYIDPQRAVLTHSFTRARNEVPVESIVSWHLVRRPVKLEDGAASVHAIELRLKDGRILRGQPHDNPERLRLALRNLDLRWSSSESFKPV